MRLEIATDAPGGTRQAGEALASLLAAGDVVALTGELGAGKTTLVQGVARGLGFTGHVASPTFTLVREYRGRLPIFHADVYRLERVQEVLDLGFEEMVDEGGVLLVEWGDAVESLLPAAHLLVELTVPGPGELRRLVLEGVGSSWEERWDALARVLARWVTTG